jgi:phosphate acetyltransferase
MNDTPLRDRPCDEPRTERPDERVEPDVLLRGHDRYDAFMRDARALPAMRTAIVHPCSAESIRAAVEARDEGMIEPVLIGPEARIRAVAEQAGVSLAGITIEAVEHSHAAAARAVEMGAAGQVAALMKGSLETYELLGAIVSASSGLRTGRRISHVYAMDVPAYSKPLFITDAAVNVTPSLDQKRDICQNTIDLLHLLGIAQPRVAVLAAIELVNARMPTTLDAAALTVMAMRGQIRGALVDGPLAFDNAISAAAAQTKGIVSPVAGQADILLVPDLEAGNMLAKQLLYFGGADAAGLVLGARLPIMLTSRSDSLRVRLASVALARIVAERTLRTAALP